MSETNLKKCLTCFVEKEATEFYTYKYKGVLKLKPYCRDCANAARRGYYEQKTCGIPFSVSTKNRPRRVIEDLVPREVKELIDKLIQERRSVKHIIGEILKVWDDEDRLIVESTLTRYKSANFPQFKRKYNKSSVTSS